MGLASCDVSAISEASTSTLDSGLKIVRWEQSAGSRQHRGVLTEVIYECAALEIRRTEMETGSTCGSLEFGDFSAVHFVIGGTPRVSDAASVPGSDAWRQHYLQDLRYGDSGMKRAPRTPSVELTQS